MVRNVHPHIRTREEYKDEAGSVSFPVEIVTHSNKHANLTLNLEKVQEIEENAVKKTEALTELDTGLAALLLELADEGEGGDVKIDISEGSSEEEITRLKAIAEKKETMKKVTAEITRLKAVAESELDAGTKADSKGKLLNLRDKQQKPLEGDEFAEIKARNLKGALCLPRALHGCS
jgi:hypothetical protein